MARKRPENRLNDLIRHGVEAVIAAKGFRRMQMEEVAARLGVSKATLYLYVESKEALFDLLVRHGDDWETYTAPGDLPLRAPDPRETLAYIERRIESNEAFNAALRLLEGPGSEDAAADVREFVVSFYRVQSAQRRTIKLVDAAASDYPELAALWFRLGRHAVMTRLVGFIGRGVASGRFSPVPNVALAARYILEDCAFWALHRHWCPELIDAPEADVEETLALAAQRFLVVGEGVARPVERNTRQKCPTNGETTDSPRQESLS